MKIGDRVRVVSYDKDNGVVWNGLEGTVTRANYEDKDFVEVLLDTSPLVNYDKWLFYSRELELV